MNFFFSLFKVISYALAGRLHFPRNRVGKEFMMDGEKWIIFREAVVNPGKDQPEKPGAIFRPRFRVARHLLIITGNLFWCVFSRYKFWFLQELTNFISSKSCFFDDFSLKMFVQFFRVLWNRYGSWQFLLVQNNRAKGHAPVSRG